LFPLSPRGIVLMVMSDGPGWASDDPRSRLFAVAALAAASALSVSAWLARDRDLLRRVPGFEINARPVNYADLAVSVR